MLKAVFGITCAEHRDERKIGTFVWFYGFEHVSNLSPEGLQKRVNNYVRMAQNIHGGQWIGIMDGFNGIDVDEAEKHNRNSRLIGRYGTDNAKDCIAKFRAEYKKTLKGFGELPAYVKKAAVPVVEKIDEIPF